MAAKACVQPTHFLGAWVRFLPSLCQGLKPKGTTVENKVKTTVRVVRVWSRRTCHLRVKASTPTNTSNNNKKLTKLSTETVLESLQASCYRYRHFEFTSSWLQNGLRPQVHQALAVWPPTGGKVCPMACERRPKKRSVHCSALVKETMPASTTTWHTQMRAVAAKAQRSLKVVL